MTCEELDKIERFSIFAKAAASLSKDRNTKIGAAILGPNFEVRSVGYNGFPRGVNDEIDERHERPLKYKYTEHAERNAIYNAARIGTPLEGSRLVLYSSLLCCTDCCRGVIQAGIRQVIWVRDAYYDHSSNPKWSEDETISRQMFEEAGVEILEISSQLDIVEVALD